MHLAGATFGLGGRPYHQTCTLAIWRTQVYSAVGRARASPLVGYYPYLLRIMLWRAIFLFP